MIRFFTGVLCLLFATSANAAVSGFYDSAAKIEAILSSAAVADAVHQMPVGSVSNTGTDKDGASLWQVRVQECDLVVRVIAILPKDIGKTRYKVEVKKPCE